MSLPPCIMHRVSSHTHHMHITHTSHTSRTHHTNITQTSHTRHTHIIHTYHTTSHTHHTHITHTYTHIRGILALRRSYACTHKTTKPSLHILRDCTRQTPKLSSCSYMRCSHMRYSYTGWRRLIGSPKLQIIFHKRATKYRSLLRKMTCKDKGSYESSPPCIRCLYIRWSYMGCSYMRSFDMRCSYMRCSHMRCSYMRCS